MTEHAQKVVAWRYVPGQPLPPHARPGMQGCELPLPCDKCGLTIHGELAGYRYAYQSVPIETVASNSSLETRPSDTE